MPNEIPSQHRLNDPGPDHSTSVAAERPATAADYVALVFEPIAAECGDRLREMFIDKWEECCRQSGFWLRVARVILLKTKPELIEAAASMQANPGLQPGESMLTDTLTELARTKDLFCEFAQILESAWFRQMSAAQVGVREGKEREEEPLRRATVAAVQARVDAIIAEHGAPLPEGDAGIIEADRRLWALEEQWDRMREEIKYDDCLELDLVQPALDPLRDPYWEVLDHRKPEGLVAVATILRYIERQDDPQAVYNLLPAIEAAIADKNPLVAGAEATTCPRGLATPIG